MRILVVNVNTTSSMTEQICRAARQYAGPDTEIVGLTPAFGPVSVEHHFETYYSAVAVVECIRAFPEAFDAIVLAGFGELGREGLEELFGVPVLDIAEAATHVAYLLGQRYALLTPGLGKLGPTADRLRIAGTMDRLVSARGTGLSVLELEHDPDRTAAALIAAARLAVTEDGAEVVCLGCAGMAGFGERVRAEVDVPVVDGVMVAVQLAEVFCRLGYSPPRTPLGAKWTDMAWPRSSPTSSLSTVVVGTTQGSSR